MRYIVLKKFSASLAVLVALGIFLGLVWAPDARLLLNVLTAATVSPGQALALSVELLVSTFFETPLLTLIYFATTAMLMGVNVSLVRAIVRIHGGRLPITASLSGGLGVFSAFLGIGCAACGSLVLASLLGTVGGAGLALLPYGGAEIGVVGLGLLGASTFLLWKALNNPLVCSPKN